MKKNGIFLFVISHLVPEIFKIFVLCKLGTDDVIRCVNIVTGQILFTTHAAAFLSLQLYSGGEQPTPQEEVFTASVSRVENSTPKLTGQVYLC